MATTIKWIDNNSIETAHRIYKSSTYFDKDSLPAPLVEIGPNITEYVDSAGVDGENWYIVSALLNDYEVFSEPFIAGLTFDYIHDVFGDGSEIITLPLILENPFLTFESNINSAIGFQEIDGFSIPIDPVADGSYSNRINVVTSSEIAGYSFWYKTYGITGESFQYLLDIRYNGDSGYLTVNSSGNDNSNSVSRLIIDSTDSDLSVAFDGVWRHIYVEFSNTTSSFTIGGRHATTSYDPSANGIFKLFRAFNRALTQEEIIQLYQEGDSFL